MTEPPSGRTGFERSSPRFSVSSEALPPRAPEAVPAQLNSPADAKALEQDQSDAFRAGASIESEALKGGVFLEEIAHPEPASASPLLVEDWIPSLAPREQALLKFLLAQEPLRQALGEGPVIELRASGDENEGALLPASAVVEINSGDAAEDNAAVRQLKGELGVLLIHNALQFLIETREFLGLCFSKLSVGGMLILTVPHQFLYERKLRLPSRRNLLHRRFYTPNTLLADLEEAIDPCESRVRFLADHDALYDYQAALGGAPGGGQDIVVAIEKIPRPSWRPALDQDEHWAETPTTSVRFLEVNDKTPAATRTIAPDPYGVNRIILLKLDHRGDFLMANEAFSMLRSAFSSSEITLVCGSWNVAEANKSGLFDRIMPFDFFPEDASARLQMESQKVLSENFAKQLSGKSYDLAVDLRLHDDTRDVLQLIKARNHAGFDRYDRFPSCTNSFEYSKRHGRLCGGTWIDNREPVRQRPRQASRLRDQARKRFSLRALAIDHLGTLPPSETGTISVRVPD